MDPYITQNMTVPNSVSGYPSPLSQQLNKEGDALRHRLIEEKPVREVYSPCQRLGFMKLE